MRNITVRLDEEMIEDLETEADEHGKTRSEHIRDTLATRHEHGTEHAEYEERIEELERENERLRAEKRTLINDREARTELVEYVEEERSWRSAGLAKRVRWWLLGRDDE